MYDDKPYYEIKYKKLGDNFCFIGYGSYNLNIVLDFKREYFELIECRDSDNYETIIERLERFVDDLDDKIDSIYKHPTCNHDKVFYNNTYAYALENCKVSIQNIVDGREYNDIGDDSKRTDKCDEALQFMCQYCKMRSGWKDKN